MGANMTIVLAVTCQTNSQKKVLDIISSTKTKTAGTVDRSSEMDTYFTRFSDRNATGLGREGTRDFSSVFLG